MSEEVPSVRRLGVIAAIAGALATVLPLLGWLSAYVALSFAESAAAHRVGDALADGMMVNAGLGALGFVAWITGIASCVTGVIRQRPTSDGRRLVFVGIGLALLAPLACCIEWSIVISQFHDLHF